MTITVTSSHPFLLDGKPGIDRFPMPFECTVSQAAEFLDVSEGFVKELLKNKRIVFRRENSKYLIDWNSLQTYGQERKRRKAALDEMVRIEQEMGLYDD